VHAVEDPQGHGVIALKFVALSALGTSKVAPCTAKVTLLGLNPVN